MTRLKRLGLLLVFSVAGLLPLSAHAQAADSILSRHIKEADGTTGQDTNGGSGVKTAHLQSGAVTATKLAPAAVGSAAIADGAVTDAKIAGPISGAKVAKAGLDADMLDGLHAGAFSTIMHGHVAGDVEGLSEALAVKANVGHDHDAAYRRRHSKVVVVADDGTGDFADPISAMAAITDASPTRPYLVKMLPGDYGITQPLVSKPNVDVEGSGEGTTRIRISDTGVSQFGFVLNGPAEFRNVTVDMTNTKGVATYGEVRISEVTLLRHMTVYAPGDQATLSTFGDVVLDDVSIAASSPEGASGLYPVALLTFGNAIVRNSYIAVTGGTGGSGLYQMNGTLDVSSTRISVRGGAEGWGLVASLNGPRFRETRVSVEGTGPGAGQIVGVQVAGTTFDHCDISARGPTGGTALRANGTTSLAYTKLDGAIVSWDGATMPRCIGVFDAATYEPISCQ